MNEIPNHLMIGRADVQHACEGIEDLDERCLAAFRAARNHYMVTNENEQFRIAVSGIIGATEDEVEKAAVKRSFELQIALASGDGAAITRLAEEVQDAEDTDRIGVLLQEFWKQAGEVGAP